ncbi:hypothetical protein MTR_5g045385 [Medicago truncatula]|uniref:Uncharacterized protein n=1 Tax=Medicago truncatula TaxID=3880 RepID=A0A072UE38_MEDTR|nr:hypothetical protein MTR_5g045385 [Medicago truncatula]
MKQSLNPLRIKAPKDIRVKETTHDSNYNNLFSITCKLLIRRATFPTRMETVMLNFHKISLRFPWSIFIISQEPKIIFTSNQTTGKLTQSSTTFMFTPKANSKQKHVKKTQENETGRAVREQRNSGKTHFSPQNPNFNFPMPKLDPKTSLTISIHVKALKTI